MQQGGIPFLSQIKYELEKRVRIFQLGRFEKEQRVVDVREHVDDEQAEDKTIQREVKLLITNY